VRSYPIRAASGVLGPKLRQGDRQVPEGLYRIELLNPNSRFHVSLRVNYPNQFDRRMAVSEGRARLGGDIMIHGNRVSIGCLAMGDAAAEDLFVLAADTGLQRIDVILAPVDLRYRPRPATPDLPGWISTLYADIRAALAALPAPDRR
jgi:murein L,D-transpeptidase YafK